jgi:hypothetical protein
MLDSDAGWRSISMRLAGSSLAVGILYLLLQGLHAALSARSALYRVDDVLSGVSSFSWSDVLVFGHALLVAAAYGVSVILVGPLLYLANAHGVAGPWGQLSRERAEAAVWIALVVWLPAWAFWLRRRSRAEVRQAVGLGVLALGCYGMLALRVAAPSPEGQKVIEAAGAARLDGWLLDPIARSTALRYQYVPSLLLMLATALALPSSVGRSRRVRLALQGAVGVWLAVSVLLDGGSVRAGRPLWKPEVLVESRLHREVSQLPPGSTVYLDNGPAPIAMVARDDSLPGRAAIALLLFPEFVVDGHRLYFVEHDPQLLRQLRAETASLLSRVVVAPTDVPRDAYYVRTEPGRRGA